jgi:hypothetical protein
VFTALRHSTVLSTAALVALGAFSAVPVSPTSPAGAPGRAFTGQVFDPCVTPALATMNAWKADRSDIFGGVGVYIGGSNRGCRQPQLTSAWVSSVNSSGWSIVPIYSGAQAPGGTNGTRISTDIATAAKQGQCEGADAAAHASALGIGPGSPIYLDMETYDEKDATVAAAVLSYTQSWDAAVHAKGYLAGFYSSADSGITQLSAAAQAGAENLPDELWTARWVSDTSTVITSTWDPVLPDTLWSARNRSRQYLGGHTVVFGGIPLDADTSYWDAPVAVVG